MASKPKDTHHDSILEAARDYDVSLKLRSFALVGEISEAMVKRLHSIMDLLEAESLEPITINLSSFGGAVDCAWAIVSRITSSKAHITVNGHGYMQSAATLILTCADFRTMTHYSWFMHHETMYSPSDMTRARELEALANRSKVDRAEWAKAMAKWTKKPAKFWETEGQHGADLYLTARECLKYGIIDKIN